MKTAFLKNYDDILSSKLSQKVLPISIRIKNNLNKNGIKSKRSAKTFSIKNLYLSN